jgi:hypothetical protein
MLIDSGRARTFLDRGKALPLAALLLRGEGTMVGWRRLADQRRRQVDIVLPEEVSEGAVLGGEDFVGLLEGARCLLKERRPLAVAILEASDLGLELGHVFLLALSAGPLRRANGISGLQERQR